MSPKSYFILLLFVSLFISHQAQAIQISGKVIDAGTKEPLIGVTIHTVDKKQGTVTDVNGRFQLSFNQPVTLVFSYLGYEPTSKSISVAINPMVVELKTQKQQLKEVTIQDKRNAAAETSQSSMILITPSKMANLPSVGGERDIIRTLQLMPGIKRGGDGAAGMYVRGGTTDQNLVLMDGITVYNPSHAIGFFSVFNNDALSEVKMWKGAFPSEVGGRVSSVMDVKTRNGDFKTWHGEAGMGSLILKAYTEGPLIKNKLSLFASARRTHLDQLMKLGGNNLPYYFYDVNTKLAWKQHDKHTLTLTYFAGNDILNIVQSEKENKNALTLDFGIKLSNQLASLQSEYIGSKTKIYQTLGFSSYAYQIDADFMQGNFNLRSSIKDYTYKNEMVNMLSAKSSLRYGMTYSIIQMNPNQSSISGSLNENLKASQGQQSMINTASAFVSHTYKASAKMELNYGVRLSNSFKNDFIYSIPEPRINVRYSPIVTLNFKASYNRMSQHMHLVSSSSALLPTDLWYSVSQKVKPQTSDQYSLSMDKSLFSNSCNLTIEGYYKDMNNLVEYREGTQLLLNDKVEEDLIQGKGRSYGVEICMQKNAGKFTGWIAYTLGWSERKFDALNNGEYFYTRYDRRHDVSIVGTYKLSKRITFSANFVWATGSRITPIVGQFLMPSGNYNDILTLPVYGKRNSLVLASSHRLDVNMVIHSKEGKKYPWELHIGGYNIYNQVQPFRTRIVNDDKGNIVYKQIGLFGFIPSIQFTIKF